MCKCVNMHATDRVFIWGMSLTYMLVFEMNLQSTRVFFLHLKNFKEKKFTSILLLFGCCKQTISVLNLTCTLNVMVLICFALVIGGSVWVQYDRGPGRWAAPALPVPDRPQAVPLPVWPQSQDPAGHGLHLERPGQRQQEHGEGTKKYIWRHYQTTS